MDRQRPVTHQQRRTIKGVAILKREKNHAWSHWELRQSGEEFCWNDLIEGQGPGTEAFEKFIQYGLARWWREDFAKQFKVVGRDEEWRWFCSLRFESYKVRPIKYDTDVIRVEVTYSEPVYVYVVTYDGTTMAGSFNHLDSVYDNKDLALEVAKYESRTGARYSVQTRELLVPGADTKEPEWFRGY